MAWAEEESDRHNFNDHSTLTLAEHVSLTTENSSKHEKRSGIKIEHYKENLRRSFNLNSKTHSHL